MRAFKWIGLLCIIFFNSFALAEKLSSPIYTEDKTNISVTQVQPQFVIRLKSNRTTGYSWFLQEYDAALITPLKHQYESPNTKLLGAPGYDVWTFSVKPIGFNVPKVTQIRFIYIRPWEKEADEKQVVFRISTE